MFKHYHIHSGCMMCRKEEASCGSLLWFYKGVIYKECHSSLNTCILDKNMLFVLPLSAIKVSYKNFTPQTQRRFSSDSEFSNVEDFFDEDGNLIPLGERLKNDFFTVLTEE